MIEERLTSPRTERLNECPLCKSADIAHAFSIPDRLVGVPGDFAYSRCSSCDSVFQNPMVIREDLHLCYPPQYQAYDYDPELPATSFDQPTNDTGLRDGLRSEVVKVVRNESGSGNGFVSVVGRVLAGSRAVRERAFYGLLPDACLPRSANNEYALEIGCGAGWFLKRLKKVGWLAEGIEWNETAANRASERTGCQVFSGDFRQVDMAKGKYSLVALNHVFEHLDDPIEALKHFRTLVKPGGRVVLIYPNPHSLDADWYRDKWYAWEAPRHLVLPSAKAIRDAAHEAGYSKVDVLTRVEINQWIGSRAYTLGLHPERSRPELNFPERVMVSLQRLLAAIGTNKGSESVVVLQNAGLNDH